MDLMGLSSIVSGQVDKKTEEERWNHCKGCTFLTKNNRCTKCGCFMKVKVKFNKAKCPIGIWSSNS
ncbi:MAG: hypothetical protein GOVbin2066_43 [Prokaryotic dsDNA virus sp.]|nr:MAG: hypothetical protein GOVbin2066_43 [Prokaryotic dsDNA virus sp.]